MHNYVTSPKYENHLILKELRDKGYNVVSENGENVIKIGGTSYKIDLYKPIWTILAEISQIEVENKKQSIKDDANSRAESYHKDYEEHMEKVKNAQKKRSFFKRMWDSARHSLSSIFRRNKTEKIEDINDANDRKIAENLAFDIKTGKQGWNRAGSDISWYCLRALDDALNANEWENQAALFA